jgi:hypothetical protein
MAGFHNRSDAVFSRKAYAVVDPMARVRLADGVFRAFTAEAGIEFTNRRASRCTFLDT